MSVRGHIDQLPDSSLIERRLAVVEWHLFASPGFDVSQLKAPEDITSQPTLSLGWQADSERWRLEHSSGTQADIKISPRLKSEDVATLKEAASAGLGIVALPAYTCHSELASGSLIRVMPDWHAGRAELSLMMPRRSGYAAPVVALQEFLQAEVGALVS